MAPWASPAHNKSPARPHHRDIERARDSPLQPHKGSIKSGALNDKIIKNTSEVPIKSFAIYERALREVQSPPKKTLQKNLWSIVSTRKTHAASKIKIRKKKKMYRTFLISHMRLSCS
jgi:hypothetical protein